MKGVVVSFLIGDDNQVYSALVVEGRPIRTLLDSKSGSMSFTVVEETDGYPKTDS